MELTIQPMQAADWDAVRAIYAEGIATGDATFETNIPDWSAWDAGHLSDCRLVACLDGQIVGWAALSPYSSRQVYRGVVHESIYIAQAARGKGVGKRLMTVLIEASEAAGYWTLQAGIFPENAASIALHTSCGFKQVGIREKIGKLHGVWRDVVLMERRSTVSGI
jgi:L-amino acid N-acyltransferase YncA